MSNRTLPRNKTNTHKIIIKAVNDYFGEGCPLKDRKLKKDICLWIMNRKKGVKLNEEQQEILWYVKTNLLDSTYRKELIRSL